MIPGFTPHYKEEEMIGGPQGALSYECSHSFHSPTCHHPTRPKMHHTGVLARVTSPHIEEVNDNARKVTGFIGDLELMSSLNKQAEILQQYEIRLH